MRCEALFARQVVVNKNGVTPLQTTQIKNIYNLVAPLRKYSKHP